MRKSLRRKNNIWWNFELASLRKKARRAWRKAIKPKQKEDWEAQKLALSYFKKAVRRAKRDSWQCFVESMNSQTPTARLVKIFRRNETVRVSNVIKHNGEFTKSPLETLNYLLGILSPGSQQIENHATRSDLVDNPFMRPEDTEMIANICSFERMEAVINEFQPFKAPGSDGLYPVRLQRDWNKLKGSRGRVEDARIEAKDTKKIRGQGQPFRGQALSRPRTGTLEAKAKEQGHKCKCSPRKKKKGLHKNFSGDLDKKTFSKRFFKRTTKF